MTCDDDEMPSQEAELFLKAFAEEVQKERKRRKLSQDQLATASGIDRGTISRFERLERLPSILALFDLAQALEIPLSKLVASAQAKMDSPSKGQSGS